MGRPKGTKNKSRSVQPVLLSDEEKLIFLADLLVEVVIADLAPKEKVSS